MSKYPKLSSFSAVLFGYLLTSDLSSKEQNMLGNWLMLAAQVLCTNAYFVPDKKSDRSEIEILESMVYALKKEIEELKKENHF